MGFRYAMQHSWFPVENNADHGVLANKELYWLHE
jgi:hypothetical protein